MATTDALNECRVGFHQQIDDKKSDSICHQQIKQSNIVEYVEI